MSSSSSTGSGFKVFQVPGSRLTASGAAAPAAGSVTNMPPAPQLLLPIATAPSVGSGSISSRGSSNSNASDSDPRLAAVSESSNASSGARTISKYSVMDSGLGRRMSFAVEEEPSGLQYSEETKGGMGWIRTGRVVRVKDSGVSFRFPLQNEHLPRVQISTAQIAGWKDKLHMIAAATVNEQGIWFENPTLASMHRASAWKVHMQKPNCVIYRQRNEMDQSKTRNVVYRGKVDGSLDELVFGLVCPTTDAERTQLAHTYQDMFLDGGVLHVAESPSKEDPFQFLGVKWMAFQSSSDSIFSACDLLVMEFSKSYTDAAGRRVLVRIIKSLGPKDCECTEHRFGFSRTQATWIQVFRASLEPGKLDVYLHGTLALGGKAYAQNAATFADDSAAPVWFASRVINTIHTTVQNMVTAADSRFIIDNRRFTDKPWVANHLRPACSVCFKSFNFMRSRHHCRSCGDIMCSTCTVEMALITAKLPPALRPDSGANHIISLEKFCLKCIAKYRQQRVRVAGALPEQSLSLATTEPADSYCDDQIGIQRLTRATSGVASPDLAGSLGRLDLNARGSASSETSNGGRAPRVPTDADSSVPSTPRTATSLGVWQVQGTRSRQPSDASSSSSMDLSAANRSKVQLLTTQSSTLRRSSIHEDKENADPDSITMMEERGSSESLDVVEVITPLPPTFSRMEESIAAQQALLRSMFLEGQKLMSAQTYAPPTPQPQYARVEDAPRALPSASTAASALADPNSLD